MASSKLSLKLVVDGKSKNVLFAEAGKEFVDFLFSLMVLPVGTVIDLLKKKDMVGCLSDLYQSIENLSDTYMLTTQLKNTLLKPKSLVAQTEFPLLITDGCLGTETRFMTRTGGFVKGAVTYMVMNDLAVQPMSSVCIITLLNKLNVREVGGLQEKVVNFGMTEALKLLKASFRSKTVLQEVFFFPTMHDQKSRHAWDAVLRLGF